MILLSFIFTFIGSTALCLAMARHHRQIWNRAADKQTAWQLRFVGCSLLIVSVAVCMWALGGPIGLVVWLGLFTGCTLLLIFLLPYAAERISRKI